MVTADFYPLENILWIKTESCLIEKVLTQEESSKLRAFLDENPIGNFVELVTEKFTGHKRNIIGVDVYQPLKHHFR
jgi:hypothetical protein